MRAGGGGTGEVELVSSSLLSSLQSIYSTVDVDTGPSSRVE